MKISHLFERPWNYLLLPPIIAAGLASILATNGGDNGDLSTIVFTSNRDGNKEIYSIISDGSSERRLTNNPAEDTLAKWSPDRERILFESNRDGNREIYLMNADGSNQVNLTGNAAIDGSPVWSPDGTRIAFVSNREGNNDVFVMNADGSNQTQITFDSDDDKSPAWSPDGEELAFASGRDRDVWTIWVKNLGSGQLRQLTHSPLSTFSPTWSPDGTEIAFITAFSTDPEPPSELWKTRADGTTPNHTPLARNVSNLHYPQWSAIESPSVKSKILFVGFVDDIATSDIYVVNGDGSGLINLTQSEHYEGPAVWGPVEFYVAFVRFGNDEAELFRMKAADGSEQIRLTDNNAEDTSPDW